MNLLMGKIVNSIVQILLFALIPFVWWGITARGKINFFQWIGVKRVSYPKENKTVFPHTGYIKVNWD